MHVREIKKQKYTYWHLVICAVSQLPKYVHLLLSWFVCAARNDRKNEKKCLQL